MEDNEKKEYGLIEKDLEDLKLLKEIRKKKPVDEWDYNNEE